MIDNRSICLECTGLLRGVGMAFDKTNENMGEWDNGNTSNS